MSQSNTAGGEEPKTDDQQQDGGDTAAPAAGTSGTSDSAPPPVDDYSSILGNLKILITSAQLLYTYSKLLEGGDIGLLITLVPQSFITTFSCSFALEILLNFDWLVH